MKTAKFIEAAREEFLAQAAYYDKTQAGLGERFIAAIEKSVSLALAFPQAGSPSMAGTRSFMAQGFPFSIFYRDERENIIIFAVAHHSRRPGYWCSRLRILP